MSIVIKEADLRGATGTYSSDGAFRVRCYVTNPEGAFEVWSAAENGKWTAIWPAELPPDRKYNVRAELWRRADHDTRTI